MRVACWCAHCRCRWLGRRTSTRIFRPDARMKEPAWQVPAPVHLEYQLRDGAARPEVSTSVRILWSDRYLYLGYECPFTELTVFEPPDRTGERTGLWDRDVVE